MEKAKKEADKVKKKSLEEEALKIAEEAYLKKAADLYAANDTTGEVHQRALEAYKEASKDDPATDLSEVVFPGKNSRKKF